MKTLFKVRCVDPGEKTNYLTKDKIYEVVRESNDPPAAYVLKEIDNGEKNIERFKYRFKIIEVEKMNNISIETNETVTLTHENKLLSCVLALKNNDIKNVHLRFGIASRVGINASNFAVSRELLYSLREFINSVITYIEELEKKYEAED
jgi:hypothetical protein